MKHYNCTATLRNVTVKSKNSDTYQLKCKFHCIGSCNCAYHKDDNWLYLPKDNKVHINEDSIDILAEAISDYDRKLDQFRKYEMIYIPVIETVLYYRTDDYSYFNCLIENDNGETIHENISLNSLIGAVTKDYYNSTDEKKRKMAYLLCYSSKETISENPLYTHAFKTEDKLFQKRLRVFYGIGRISEWFWVKRVKGKKLLPALSEQYNRYYIVDPNTIAFTLLYDSGYVIYHRPYFSMKDSTHEYYSLNPHTKDGVDAAKVYDQPISFDEYIKLFENSK